ncbi:sensor histidine kinase [Actinomyces bowdenii]|uniref:histidine kinase n=1 Tax=Actinomyces bowdenii TaxID=131109 RepID=A0A853EJ79_9ACTO|nr:HAMP domain-containing sensor histidine kinase [Actinomyces bowdenii]MBF0697244.1 HAMP domain-containing histidine kinase [Actinomyces bowdenii]NYS69417.1 HAMP domain-containing histidine kinase [Actinomyces bowdenii]
MRGRPQPGGLGRPRRLSIRARLTLTYTGVVAVSGAVLIALVYFYTRYAVLDVYVLVPAGGGQWPQGVGPVEAAELAVAADDALGEETGALATIILRSAVIALLALTLLSGTIGWILAGRMLRPLSSMSRAARRAASGDLRQRLALSGPHDEIHDLADTFDGMLASLERAFEVHRRFAANASHELRTPLATTKTMIDVALTDPHPTVEGLREVLVRVRQTNDANRELIDALLDLADAQAGELEREEVDIAAIIRGELVRLCDQAHHRGLHVQCALEEPRVRADPVLLRQAVSNLLRNAVRHSAEGGRVMVRVHSRPPDRGRPCAVRLTVDNDGPVIPAERIPVLREPFVRGQGRSRGAGHGLGLAIVSAVVTAHEGELHLHARPAGGLGVVMDLPGAPGRS